MNLPPSRTVRRWNSMRGLLFITGILLTAQTLPAQTSGVVISDDTSTVAHPSAILDVSVTAPSKKGVLVPLMTENERLAIDSPANGLLVFQTDGATGFYYYDETLWTGIASTTQEDWQSPQLTGGWTNYGGEYSPAAYFRDSNGIVHLRGLIRNGSGNILTLPVGYRPAFREIRVVLVGTTGNSVGRVDILADGTVTFIAGSNSWVSLDGITFRAGGN